MIDVRFCAKVQDVCNIAQFTDKVLSSRLAEIIPQITEARMIERIDLNIAQTFQRSGIGQGINTDDRVIGGFQDVFDKMVADKPGCPG